MYRKIMGFLEVWKESEHRKPLILQGARQVGKTYSILEFGRTHYENVAYCNFETNPKPVSYTHLDVYKRQFVSSVHSTGTARADFKVVCRGRFYNIPALSAFDGVFDNHEMCIRDRRKRQTWYSWHCPAAPASWRDRTPYTRDRRRGR